MRLRLTAFDLQAGGNWVSFGKTKNLNTTKGDTR